MVKLIGMLQATVRSLVKPGDLVRWRTDGDIGVILSVRKGSRIGGSTAVYVMWFNGPPTGALPDDHEQLELISESR